MKTGLATMQLNEEQLGFIGNHVRIHINEWIDEEHRNKLKECIVRMGESLNRQFALVKQGYEYTKECFVQVDKRFNQLLTPFITFFVLMLVCKFLD